VFTSTPSYKAPITADSQKQDAEAFVLTLYDSVTSSGAMAQVGICQTALQVGTVKCEKDNLVAAETDYKGSGPAFDVRLWQRFLKAHSIPLRLSVMCLNSTQVRLQSYWYLAPVCIIRYKLTNRTLDIFSMW